MAFSIRKGKLVAVMAAYAIVEDSSRYQTIDIAVAVVVVASNIARTGAA